MLVFKTIASMNGASQEIHYLKEATLRRHYPGASPQDCIRLVIKRPDLQKQPIVDYFMTAGEAMDLICGLSNAIVEALDEDIPFYHVDKPKGK